MLPREQATGSSGGSVPGTGGETAKVLTAAVTPTSEVEDPAPIAQVGQMTPTKIADLQARDATATAIATAVPKEKPDSLNEKNYPDYVTSVSEEEFKALAAAQPDAFAFPIKQTDTNEDLRITYKDKPIK